MDSNQRGLLGAGGAAGCGLAAAVEPPFAGVSFGLGSTMLLRVSVKPLHASAHSQSQSTQAAYIPSQCMQHMCAEGIVLLSVHALVSLQCRQG